MAARLWKDLLVGAIALVLIFWLIATPERSHDDVAGSWVGSGHSDEMLILYPSGIYKRCSAASCAGGVELGRWSRVEDEIVLRPSDRNVPVRLWEREVPGCRILAAARGREPGRPLQDVWLTGKCVNTATSAANGSNLDDREKCGAHGATGSPPTCARTLLDSAPP